MDALQVALGLTVLCFVWRLQEVFPLVGRVRLPTLAGVAAVGFYLVSPDRRRRFADIRHPIVTTVLVLLGLAVLSVPGSLWPGKSFSFITQDFRSMLAPKED